MSVWKGGIKKILAQINPNGGFDVNIQDQTSPLFRYFLIQEQKTNIKLSATAEVNDTVVSVGAGHGFTAVPGEIITMFYNNRLMQQTVNGVTGTNIGISTPITTQFDKAATIVIRGNKNMNIDGAATPTSFQMKLRNFTVPIDVSKVILTMQHGAGVGDDWKFGGIAALTNGIYFRKENSTIFSLGNYKENQDFKDSGGDVSYTEKAPAGTNATDVIFDFKKIFGQVMRIDPRLNDVFKGVVRDKVDTLDKFTISLIGSYTEGE